MVARDITITMRNDGEHQLHCIAVGWVTDDPATGHFSIGDFECKTRYNKQVIPEAWYNVEKAIKSFTDALEVCNG